MVGKMKGGIEGTIVSKVNPYQVQREFEERVSHLNRRQLCQWLSNGGVHGEDYWTVRDRYDFLKRTFEILDWQNGTLLVKELSNLDFQNIVAQLQEYSGLGKGNLQETLSLLVKNAAAIIQQIQQKEKPPRRRRI